ncbi:MAG: ribosomal protein S18-alanine N-acetyltransferase [Chloroflexota bacterium]
MTATLDGQDPSLPAAPDPEVACYRLARMRASDVPDIAGVERRCFTNPWPASAYRRELQHGDHNYYLVLRDVTPHAEEPETEPGGLMPRRGLLPLGIGRRPRTRPAKQPVAGFAGMWNAFDEAHLTTIGVDIPYRGRGLGEALLAAVFDEAVRRGVNWVTLEVRVSNETAQALYRKWGFTVQGTRKRYYSDNNEDAYIMWSRALSDASYQAELAALRSALMDRLRGAIEGLDVRSPEPSLIPPAGRPPWELGGD